jgi:hypothetical protein
MKNKKISIKKDKRLLVISFSILAVLAAVLIFVYFRYNSCMVELSEQKEIITQQQQVKTPLPPQERYVSGVIKNVGENSLIIRSNDGRETEVFFNDQTEVLKGEGKGEKVSQEEIQPNYHAACFLPKDKNNNLALIVHLVKEIKINN